jgi:7-carboxy-7-deazaguanine synthase
MEMLCARGYVVSLETGGSLDIQNVDPRVRIILDIKCPGSGMAHKNQWANLDKLRVHDEVKFVLADERDYAFAKEICLQKKLAEKITVLFSPVFGILDPKELVAWILKDKLPVRLNLQIHKYIWTPETRGV